MYNGARAATKGALIASALCFLTSGCRAGYVARVGLEHLRYIRTAVPIEQVVLETTDDTRRERLELVLEARGWAAEHGLDVGGSYASVADTTGLATAHVVTAAYADRLEPYEWRYPIVGRIPYRGYFEREPADRFAAKLAEEGFDTYVVEASGYSTLGWFDDPLPSGILELDRAGIVSFLFHELLHQTVYVPGWIAFNETLATAVSGRMTEQFFRERDDDEALDLLRERSERWLEQALLCDGLAERLELYFGEEAENRSGRNDIYRSAVADFRRLQLLAEAKEGVAEPKLNNAWFLAVWRYRKSAARFVAYLHGFDSISAALADLESRLEGVDDPYEVLPPAASPS